MLSIVLCVYLPSVCILWRNVCLGLLPIFFDLVVYIFGIEMHELLVYLEINPLSLVSFAIIFSHSEGFVL